MSERKTYLVKVTREGDTWLADVPELQGAHTYARNLQALERYVREVIVIADDLPDDAGDTFYLEWTFDTAAIEAGYAKVAASQTAEDRDVITKLRRRAAARWSQEDVERIAEYYDTHDTSEELERAEYDEDVRDT